MSFCYKGNNSAVSRTKRLSTKKKRTKHVAVVHCSSDGRLTLSSRTTTAGDAGAAHVSSTGVRGCTSLDQFALNQRREKAEDEQGPVRLDNFLKDAMERRRISRILHRYNDTPALTLKRDPQILKKHRPSHSLLGGNDNVLCGPPPPKQPQYRGGSISKQSPRKRSRVSFASVQIRSYETILGDNPGCSEGPPLSLGWHYNPSETTTLLVDQHERSRIETPPARHELELFVTRSSRESLLRKVGYSRKEIASATMSCRRIQSERRQTSIFVSSSSSYDVGGSALEGMPQMSCATPFSCSTGDVRIVKKWKTARHMSERQHAISKQQRLQHASLVSARKPRQPQHRCQSTSDLGDDLLMILDTEVIWRRHLTNDQHKPRPPAQASGSTNSQLNAQWPVLTAVRKGDSLNERASRKA